MSKSKTNVSLNALNEILFEQLEAVSNPDISDEDFEKEKERTEMMTKLGKVIIDNARLELSALKLAAEYGSDEVLGHNTMFLLGEKK